MKRLDDTEREAHERSLRARESAVLEKAADLESRDVASSEREADATLREADATEREADATEREAGATEREAGATEREAGATEREAGATLREAGATLREAGATEREAGATLREADATEREEDAERREDALDLQEALARAEQEWSIWETQLREANQQLVLATLRSEQLTDESVEARAVAEAAREKLEKTEAALRQANHRKDEFLAMLGHELRNPLAPILTAVELMKLRAPTASVREREVIERQTRHMIALVDDLLDISRITSGKVELRRGPLEIWSVVERAVELASPLLERRRHSFSATVARTGLAVDGDAMRLVQVLSNLLTNAAKYTEPGGTISLAAGREGGWIRVSVSDTGIGIAPDLLPVLFDSFVQGEQAIERAAGGLGLGLAIVRSLVELHGGEVSAHSAGRGQGSELVVRLPALERPCITPKREEQARERLGARGPRRVLVVDDNVDAAEMLAEALRAIDRQVEIAHDGPEALRVAPGFQPDAVVIDIGLPIMDGYELARRLRDGERGRADGKRLRLVAVTGYGEERDRQRSVSAGVDVHLVKPVDLAALDAALAGEPARSAAPEQECDRR